MGFISQSLLVLTLQQLLFPPSILNRTCKLSALYQLCIAYHTCSYCTLLLAYSCTHELIVAKCGLCAHIFFATDCTFSSFYDHCPSRTLDSHVILLVRSYIVLAILLYCHYHFSRQPASIFIVEPVFHLIAYGSFATLLVLPNVFHPHQLIFTKHLLIT